MMHTNKNFLVKVNLQYDLNKVDSDEFHGFSCKIPGQSVRYLRNDAKF